MKKATRINVALAVCLGTMSATTVLAGSNGLAVTPPMQVTPR